MVVIYSANLLDKLGSLPSPLSIISYVFGSSAAPSALENTPLCGTQEGNAASAKFCKAAALPMNHAANGTAEDASSKGIREDGMGEYV